MGLFETKHWFINLQYDSQSSSDCVYRLISVSSCRANTYLGLSLHYDQPIADDKILTVFPQLLYLKIYHEIISWFSYT